MQELWNFTESDFPHHLLGAEIRDQGREWQGEEGDSLWKDFAKYLG